jgi:anti-sigma-K factor RskA
MPRIDRYQDPKLYERLAGEYVLGTLQGRARQRFAQLVEQRGYLRNAVNQWEQRLDPLSTQITAQSPPNRVWRNISRELDLIYNQSGRIRLIGFWNNILLWRSTTFTAIVFLIVSLFYSWLPHTPSPRSPSYLAVLKSNQDAPMFVATASFSPMQMKVMMMDESVMYPNKDLELWCVMKQSGETWSLGVLARKKETVFAMNQHEWQLMGDISSLTVSVEPMGGSPTGQPTGSKVYTGELMSLI